MADKPRVDGFYPRRPNTRGDSSAMGFDGRDKPSSSPFRQSTGLEPVSRPRPAPKDTFRVPSAVRPDNDANTNNFSGLIRPEIEESLKSIDEDQAAIEPKSSGGRKDNKRKKPSGNKKRLVKRVVLAIVVIGAVGFGFMSVKGILASNAIFNGDIFGIIQQQPLKQDSNGRTNIVIFGTSEDDEGGDHPGAFLTDSIQLVSVDQSKNDAYMVGIPRDLWVDYGMACTWGYDGKINALYQCYAGTDGSNEAAGSAALKDKISEVTGLGVQYYVHVNYGVVRETVDAVGGINLTIPDYDPMSPGIYDPNFDWKCNYVCKMVNYKDNERVTMDGEHALAFTRARNAAGGYGLPNGNFDREKNQQLVLKALQEKALSVGTLANPIAVTQLIDAMGSNLRTDFQTSEIRTLMSLGSAIKPEAIHSISLNKPGELAVTTGSSADGQSIVRPVSGIYDYSSVKNYIKRQINSEPYMLESASLAVLNGSGVTGLGKEAADVLSEMGFTIDIIDNAPVGQYARREVYARQEAAYPATRQKLQSLYGTLKPGISQFNVPDSVDFVIVVGQADNPNQ